MVDEKTGRFVEGKDQARGYELQPGSYVEIEPDELEAVEVESTRTIDIDKFVPEEEIDKRYYERLTTSFPMIRVAKKPSPSFGMQ